MPEFSGEHYPFNIPTPSALTEGSRSLAIARGEASRKGLLQWGRGRAERQRSLGMRLERARAALREGKTSDLPHGKGRRQSHKRERRNSVRARICGIGT